MTGTPAFEIRFEDGADRARYVATLPGHPGEGELVLIKRSPDLWVADHTGVDPRLEGRGMAAALVARMVEDARAAGRRIVPRCSYVQAKAERIAAWQDVFAL